MNKNGKRPRGARDLVLPSFLRLPQIRSIGTIALGAGAGHTALLLASPVLTRIYSPDQFGIYTFFFALLGFVAPLSTLRFDVAVLIPESSGEAWDIMLTSLAATVLVSSLSLGLLLGLSLCDLILVGTDYHLVWLILAISTGVLISGSCQTLTHWAVRHSAFGIVAISRGGVGAATGIFQVALGLLRTSPVGLVVGDLAGRALAGIILIRSLFKTLPPERRRISMVLVWTTALRYRGFALLSSPALFLNGAALYSPLVLVGHLHGASAAGWMFMAQRFVALPTSLLSSPTSQVYSHELARTSASGRVSLYRNTLIRLMVLSGPVFLLAGLLAPLLFPLILGVEWAEAGWMATVLVPYHFFQLLSGATISTLDLLQLHWVRLMRELLFLGATIGIFAAGYIFDLSLPFLMMTFGICGGAFYASSVVWVHLLLKKRAE